MTEQARFWEEKTLEEMTPEEWESLCDGCGICCTQIVEDIDSGEFVRLAVSCRLLDTEACRCSDYPNRFATVPGCMRVTPEVARSIAWLPKTCAYRLVARGEPLKWWHPLISGDAETVHAAKVSVRGRVVSEEWIDEDEALDYILE